MPNANEAIEVDSCFKLKGSRITMTVLELYEYEHASFNEQLSRTVENAPDFFQQTPIIIGLGKIKDPGFIDFIEIGELCREFGLVPVAIKGGSEEQILSANVAGLPSLPASREHSSRKPKTPELERVKENAKNTKETETKPNTDNQQSGSIANNKVINVPIRSGQQVYAPGGDLVVMAAVSAGAEILADGNIHVYGPLRGRALAGVKGNSEAHIFCRSMEAEMISIAGHYKISEDLRQLYWKKPVQASLSGDQLDISLLK